MKAPSITWGGIGNIHLTFYLQKLFFFRSKQYIYFTNLNQYVTISLMKAPSITWGGGIGNIHLTFYLQKLFFFRSKQYIYFSLCVEIYIYFTSLYIFLSTIFRVEISCFNHKMHNRLHYLLNYKWIFDHYYFKEFCNVFELGYF